MHEWPIVVHHLQRIQEVARSNGVGVRDQCPPIAVLAEANVGDSLRQRVRVVQADGTGRGEVAFTRVVRPLLVFETGRKLWDDEVKVRPAVAVRMRTLIDDHAVDSRAQIGAVIEVEAAQVELIGFAFATVLTDDQPGALSRSSPGR